MSQIYFHKKHISTAHCASEYRIKSNGERVHMHCCSAMLFLMLRRLKENAPLIDRMREDVNIDHNKLQIST